MGKSKHKSKAHSGGGQEDYGRWTLDKSSRRYYRLIDQNGEVEWYDEGGGADQDEIPRITEEFRGLSTSPASTTSSGAYYALDDSNPKAKSKSSKPKGKGKHRARHGETDDANEADATAPGNYDVEQAYEGEAGSYVDQELPVVSETTGQYHSTYSQDETTYNQDYDAEDMAATVQLSSHTYSYGSGGVGVGGGGESSTSVYAGVEDDDDGRQTPRPIASAHISAAGLDESIKEVGEDSLDPRYQVYRSSAFQPGYLFKVLWSEPQGGGNDTASTISGIQSLRNAFGAHVFVGFRRFIVVANDEGHCACVPILTYGQKACTKKGVKPLKHGIIYHKKPKLLAGEPTLGFPPIQAKMWEGETLSKESRVNYAKLVTVEHNVRVFFIGNLTDSDTKRVSDAVNKCWSSKHHGRK